MKHHMISMLSNLNTSLLVGGGRHKIVINYTGNMKLSLKKVLRRSVSSGVIGNIKAITHAIRNFGAYHNMYKLAYCQGHGV